MFYPHRCQVWRTAEADVEVRDEYGRLVPGAPAIVATVGCWVQALSAQEQSQITNAGAVRSDHLIFVDPPSVGLSEGDALKTIAGGGQGDTIFQVDAIDDPDGTSHHYEVYAHQVKQIEDVLEAPAAVSS